MASALPAAVQSFRRPNPLVSLTPNSFIKGFPLGNKRRKEIYNQTKGSLFSGQVCVSDLRALTEASALLFWICRQGDKSQDEGQLQKKKLV